MKYGLGYIRDAAHRRTQRPLAAHPLLIGAGAVTLSGASSLESFEAPILDQGQSSSCGGGGTSQGIATSLAAIGDPLPWTPSPAGIYGVTRAIARSGANVALTDSGVMPADVMAAISRYGIRPMRGPTPDGRNYDVWTEADGAGSSNVNDEPLEGDLDEGQGGLLVGEYRIDEAASDAPERAAQTLEIARAAVGVGAFVDTAVMRWQKGDAPLRSVNLQDQNGGGHWFAVTSYRRDPSTGELIFRSPNSWGTGYGDAGHWEFTASWLRQAAWDLYALTVRRAS